MSQEITKKEILDAVMAFSGRMDQRFDALEGRIARLEVDVATLKSDVSTLKFDVGNLQSEGSSLRADVNYLKTHMVTKDYLDERLWKMGGDMLAMMTRKVQDHEFRLHPYA